MMRLGAFTRTHLRTRRAYSTKPEPESLEDKMIATMLSMQKRLIVENRIDVGRLHDALKAANSDKLDSFMAMVHSRDDRNYLMYKDLMQLESRLSEERESKQAGMTRAKTLPLYFLAGLIVGSLALCIAGELIPDARDYRINDCC